MVGLTSEGDYAPFTDNLCQDGGTSYSGDESQSAGVYQPLERAAREPTPSIRVAGTSAAEYPTPDRGVKLLGKAFDRLYEEQVLIIFN